MSFESYRYNRQRKTIQITYLLIYYYYTYGSKLIKTHQGYGRSSCTLTIGFLSRFL